MKRRISWFLIVVMLVLLGGCTSEKPMQETNPSDSAATIIGEPEAAQTPEAVQTPEATPAPVAVEDKDVPGILREKYPDKPILTWTYSNITDFLSPDVKLAVNEELDRLGYDFVIDFVLIEYTKYSDTVSAMVESETPPDIICAGLGEEDEEGSTSAVGGTYNAYKKGWFLCLDEYFASEDGRKLKEALPEAVLNSCRINGSCYGVSSFSSAYTYAYIVNGDLMEQYGITEEELAQCGIEELEPYLDRVAAGESDCRIFTPYGERALAAKIFGLESVSDSDGKGCMLAGIDCKTDKNTIINLLDSENVKSYLTAINEYGQRGYISSEEKSSFFLIVSSDDISSSNIEDKVANVANKYTEAGNIIAIDNVYPFSMLTQKSSVTGVCAKSGQQQLALEALTAVMTEKSVSELLLYGIEGKDYRIADGKADSDAWFASVYFGNRYIITQGFREPDNKEEVLNAFFASALQSKALGIYFDFTDIADKVQEINAIYGEYSDLINGISTDPEADFAELAERVKAAGIDEVVAELNRQMEEKS